MHFWINSFPIPPSINAQLMASRGRMIKTGAARVYDRSIDLLRVKRSKEFIQIRQQLEPYLKEHVLKVDQFFAFDKKRVFTKSKTAADWVKVLDHQNFSKSSQDALAKALCIDDKFFFGGVLEKIYVEHSFQEQVCFRVSLMKPRSLSDLAEQQKLDEAQGYSILGV